MSEAYPFESDDDEQIRELDVDSVDKFADARITVGELVGENESWRYGHVIVDEAQDLTPMQWRMVMRRVRGRSITIVGDVAQRSNAPGSAWSDLLPAELADSTRQDLTVNYRSPEEIHTLAVAVLAQFAPDVVPAVAIRSAGSNPVFNHVDTVEGSIVEMAGVALASVAGQVAVIGSEVDLVAKAMAGYDEDRVRLLTPNQSKGLEFDAVVLVEPAAIVDSAASGYAQLYIALTRATQYLFVIHEQQLPTVLVR